MKCGLMGRLTCLGGRIDQSLTKTSESFRHEDAAAEMMRRQKNRTQKLRLRSFMDKISEVSDEFLQNFGSVAACLLW